MGWKGGSTAKVVLPVYYPSGDNSGAEDIGQINNHILQDGGVQLGLVPTGGKPYKINAPFALTADGMAVRGVNAGNPVGGNAPNPRTAGTIVVLVAGFAGAGALVAQIPDLSRALRGVDVRDIAFDGNLLPAGSVHGVIWEVFNGFCERVWSARMTGDGFVLQSAGSTTFPLGTYDNRMSDLFAYNAGGNGITILDGGATDNQIDNFKAVGCAGYGIENLSPGQQFNDFHIYAHPGAAAIHTITRSTTLRGRLSEIQQHGVLIVDDITHSDSFTLELTGVRDCGMATDNTYDVVNYAPGADVRGGRISINVLTTQANRPRYGINLVNAHCIDTVIEVPSQGYIAPAASTFGTADINSAPATTPKLIPTKAYVDAVALGLTFKQPADLATIAVLPSNIYANGAAGVGATLTATGFGALSVDGTVVTVGQRILVKNEAAQANNGIYIVTIVGDGSTAYVLTRATDFNQSSEIQSGDSLFVSSGGTLADTQWVQTTTGAIVVGTTAIVFSRFGATPSLSAVLAVGNDAGGSKIVNGANGTSALDVALFGQIPTVLSVQNFATGILVPDFPAPTTQIGVANRAFLMRFLCKKNAIITKIAFQTSIAATNNDNCDVGIYSADGTTLLGSAGSTAGKLNAVAGIQTLALAAPVTLVAGTVYYVAFAYGAVGGTAATLVCNNAQNALGPTIMGATLPNLMQSFQSGAFPLAAPHTSAGGQGQVPILALLL